MAFAILTSTGQISGLSQVVVYDSNGRIKYIGGGGGSAVWGSITGTITAQTDLISYLSGNYVPLTRNITINGVTQDLSVDRTWTIAGGGTVTSVQLAAGTGISLSGTNPITTSGTITVTNSAPDQTVSLGTTGTGLAVTGTYPNFTLQNTLPDQTVALSAGTGISVSGTYPSFTITNTSPSTGGSVLSGTASGTDTYTATITGPTSYTDGDAYLIRFTNGNTTGCTLDINGLGAKDLYKNNDGLLIGGDIQSGGEMLCVYNSTLNGFQVIGTSPNSLIAYVTNDDSVTITKGQAVYAFSGTGDRMTVKRALNTGDSTSAQTVGLVLSTSIAANQKGFIMMQGLLDGLSILPTATWSDGDPVYLGATAGSITNVKPYAPNHLVYLGFVTTASNGSAGRLYVRVQNGYELDELHNVQAQTPTYKDTLYFDNTVSPSQWKTASISTILGYTPLSAAITSLNGLTGATQTFATGTTGTDFGISSSGTAHTFNLPTASASNRGALSSTDWSTFNGKVPSTRTLTIDGTSYDLSADRSWTTTGGTYSSYTMKGNNTGSTAAPADHVFRYPGNQSFSGTISTSAGNWGAGSYYYNWHRIGNMVNYTFQFIVTTPLAITSINWDLPADMPSPIVPSGFSANSVWLIRNFVTMVTTTTGTTQTTFFGGLRVKSTVGPTFDFYFSGTSGSYKTVTYNGTYFTS
jgi:hypothetical protein